MQEQKDKILAFAEKIGWRIWKENEGAIAGGAAAYALNAIVGR